MKRVLEVRDVIAFVAGMAMADIILRYWARCRSEQLAYDIEFIHIVENSLS
jgi:hypothetical protein